ncbi:MAG: O-antigen ligase family protein, partial [Actinomycetota bacterium]|nr:O-antigen ligase family protein [Actinomycetota bacterium]
MPVPPRLVIAAAFLAACVVGLALAVRMPLGIGLLVAFCYVPLVLLNLPLGLALWVVLVFVERVPAVSIGPTAAALLIAFAWLGAVATGPGSRLHVLRRHRVLAAAAAALLVWLTLSLAWSEDVGLSAEKAWQWYAAVLLLAIVATTVSTPRQLRLILAAFLVGALVSVAAGVVGAQPPPDPEQIGDPSGRLGGSYGDPNYLAAGVVPAIALAMALLVVARGALVRLGLVVAVAVLAVALAATESRGGWIAAVVAVAGALALLRGRRLQVALVVTVVVSLAGVVVANSPTAWERIVNPGGGAGRVELWEVAWRITEDHPLAGVGLNNFRVFSPRYVRQPGTLEEVALIVDRPLVVHNVYLELLAENGAIGLLAFLALAGASL